MDRFVDVPGGRLWVADDGTGPPIVLLHAGIADLRAWDPMVAGLVAAGHRAVRYDARGFGRTVTEDVPFSNRADLVAVLDALGIERAALVGNSRGGQIAFDTAVEFPDRIVAVVGVGAGLGGFETEIDPDEQPYVDEAERLEAEGKLDPDAIADIDVRLWVDGPRQPADRVPAAIREAVRAMDRPQYLPGVVSGQPIPLAPTVNERLADLRCPVLAVAGTLDLGSMTSIARHLASNAPDATAVIMPGVAHMIGLEAPDELTALIVEFLRPLRPWA
jgi:pimeloyl-ACP methyl ester carboxylesterase